MSAATFPALLQRFFTQRLLAQRGASPHTIASYRDTFRLLLGFASERLERRLDLPGGPRRIVSGRAPRPSRA